MKKKISGILAIVMLFSLFLNNLGFEAYAATDYVTAAREVNPQIITPDKEVEVNLKVTGTPPVNVVKPNDVILVLDKSGSMDKDNRFGAMKESAKEFIDLFDFNSHNAGVVDFSSSTRSLPLTNDATALKDHINSMRSGGGTETGYAIREAMKLLKSGREEAQPVIVLLTDGEANNTADALKAAQEAKQAGIVFYTIALLAPGEDENASAPNLLLRDMATTAKHHNFVLGSVGLMDIYRRIVKEIGISSAYDVEIKETVSPQFEIVPGSYENNIPKPKVEGNTLTWNMLELKTDTIELKYKVRLKAGEKAGKYNIAESSKITYKDYAGANCSYDIANSLIEVKYHAPIITSVTNEKGQVAGGEKVTIKGEHFRPAATVSFNANKCTDVVVVDSNTITVTTPPGVQGNATITVTNDDLQKATADFNYYADPVVTSLSPNVGPYVGDQLVTINGSYFMDGMKVKFGETYGNTAYYNSGKVIVTTPPATQEGVVDVTLENPDGTKTVIEDGYTYEPQPTPTITSISPASGKTAGGETVVVNGENFEKGLEITFGANKGEIISFVSSKQLKVKVPAGSEGIIDVTVTNPTGKQSIAKGAYEYIAPPPVKITSISPNSGSLKGGELVYIEGENFVYDTKLQVKIGENPGEGLYFFGPNKIRIKVPANATPGKYDVTIVNGDGQTFTLPEGYEYLAPPPPPPVKMTSISPNSGSLKGGELVYIEGENFVSGDKLKVTIGGIDVPINYFYGPNKIRVKAPANPTPGKYDVTIVNGNGQTFTLPEAYEYLAPPPPPPVKITSISPNSGSTNGGELVYIQGENFVSGDKLKITIGGIDVPVNYFYGPNSIRVKAPANAIPGKYDVSIVNGDGQTFTLPEAYEYITPPPPPAPEITTLSSTSGYETGGDLLYIQGKNFVSGLKVTIGGIDVPVNYFYGPTQIRVKVPRGTVGMANVVITNPDGQSSVESIQYEYLEAKCEITSLSSVEGKMAGEDLVYITGVNFQPGLKVFFGTEEVSGLTYYSATSIRVKVPASAVPGDVDVKIINGDGKTTIKTNAYKYIAPPAAPAPVMERFALNGVTVTSLKQGGYVYIIGSGFASGCKVDVLNASGDVVCSDLALNYYYDTTNIRVRFPATMTPGMYKVIIKNPDGQRSNPLDLEITK
jgi:uncharacterized protein YegL